MVESGESGVIVNSHAFWFDVKWKKCTYKNDEKDDEKPHAVCETCAKSSSEQAELLLLLEKLKQAKGDDLIEK